MADQPTVYTVGHSNTPFEVLLDVLLTHHIARIADVRRYPMSRRNPQFNANRLEAALAEHDIGYVHKPGLGGRRTPLPDSSNTALRDEGFRGFADYAQTPEFEAALTDLIVLAREKPTAIMCAESLPARCHRSLIADTLLSHRCPVVHLIGHTRREHTLSPTARISEDCLVTYPGLL